MKTKDLATSNIFVQAREVVELATGSKILNDLGGSSLSVKLHYQDWNSVVDVEFPCDLHIFNQSLQVFQRWMNRKPDVSIYDYQFEARFSITYSGQRGHQSVISDNLIPLPDVIREQANYFDNVLQRNYALVYANSIQSIVFNGHDSRRLESEYMELAYSLACQFMDGEDVKLYEMKTG